MIGRASPLASLAIVLGCALPVKVGELDGTTTIDTAMSSETLPDDPPPESSSSSESGDPPPVIRHDYAIRYADLPALDSTGNSTSLDSGGDSGDPFDPDSLVVTATIGIDTCEDPYAAAPCGERWSVSFNLPPELQVLGATGRLEDNNGFLTETGPLRPEGDCFGGGGSLLGTFEITAIDGAHVAGHLGELELADVVGTELDFDATRC